MGEKRSSLKAIVLNKSMIPYVAISIFAIVFFISIYGVKVLDFQNVDWLYGHYEVKENCFYGKDLTQHYMGWLCYRQSDWTFPIGNMNLFSYPYQTSVIYTDSIPLFALFFKILSPVLPEKFQYFGLWAILCFVLQGIMAVRLFKSYTKNPVKLVLAAAFFVIVPMLLWRTFIHSALCAHWIILMAMEPLVDKVRWGKKHLMIHYSLVGFLASMTAIYLLLFCGIVLIGTCVRDVLETKKVLNSVLSLISFVGVAALAIAIMGGFSGEFESSLDGLGLFSMNLNTFFDSYGFSTIFRELPRYIVLQDTQFEGYGYLGAGFIILIMISTLKFGAILKCSNEKIRHNRNIAISLFIVLLISFIFSTSPNVSVNDVMICSIQVPDIVVKLWSIFRATGRGVWIIVYVVMFINLRIIQSFEKKWLSYFVLIGCFIVQIFDGYNMYKTIHSYFNSCINAYYKYENMTASNDFWDEIADDTKIKNILLANTTIPYDDESHSYIFNVYDSYIGPSTQSFKLYQYFLGDFAIKNNKTFNYFRFSRHPYDRSREYVLERLDEPNDSDLYVFSEYNKFRGFAAGLHMYYVDGIYIGSTSLLNEKYVIDRENGYRYWFSESDEIECADKEYYLLEGQNEIKFFSMELPKGLYLVAAYSSDPAQIEYDMFVDSGCIADVYYMEEQDEIAYYFISVNEDTCRAYSCMRNVGNDDVEIYGITINYVGTIDEIYE